MGNSRMEITVCVFLVMGFLLAGKRVLDQKMAKKAQRIASQKALQAC